MQTILDASGAAKLESLVAPPLQALVSWMRRDGSLRIILGARFSDLVSQSQVKPST